MFEIDFLSFATTNWKESRKRISSQIKQIQTKYKFFRKTSFFSEKDLEPEYFKKFGKYLSDRGYAYYSWKPWIILKALDAIKENQYLLYMDGGCSFPNGEQCSNFLNDIRIKCEEMKNKSIDFGCATTPKHIPVDLTIRMEILKYFNLNDDMFFRKKYPHFQAGMMLIKKTKTSKDIIKKLMDFFIDHYEEMIHVGYTDKNGQAENFIHFTGDQAVLQCLFYLNNVEILNCFDPFFTYNVYARIRK